MVEPRIDPNPFVASGEFERVYACEVEPGDVLVFGETVTGVERLPFGNRVRITTDQGETDRNASGTVLVKTGRTLDYIGERPTGSSD